MTLWFAESFLCTVERRRGVMLGSQLLRPSAASFFVFEGGCCVMRGKDMFLLLTSCCFRVQVGNGSDIDRYTPVGVSGLGSGIAMIALGGVSFVAIASGSFVLREQSLCI